MRVALVACAKTKRAEPCPARDLYTSDLFVKSRACAERHADRWYVLSARHGLLHPDTVTAPYEEALSGLPAAERRRWGQHVAGQLRTVCNPIVRDRWVRKLRALLATEAAYGILDREIGTWTAGGCWILADALRPYLGPGAKLVALGDRWCSHHHVLVQVGDDYYDADGCAPRDRLLRRWETRERVAGDILPFDPEIACRVITHRPAVVERLRGFLGARLGPLPQPALLVLAGRAYWSPIAPSLPPGWPAATPLAGLGIGQQKRWLRDAARREGTTP